MSKCNQYRHQHEFTWKHTIATALFATVPLMGVFNAVLPTHIDASENVNIISPIATTAASLRVVEKSDSTPAEMSPEQQLIENEVKEVFGKDYDKAKMVLDCENHARNPKAINDNTKWGGKGKDWGIFQINDEWQGVTNKAFLTDYHINIRMAYNIFKSWGNNFQAWTCGKKFGI